MQNDKEIIREIKTLLSAGKKKQEVFEELKSRSHPPLYLARLIAKFPNLQNKRKYRSLNILLIVLLSLTLLFDLLSLNYPGMLWDIGLLYLASTFKVNQYQWIIFRAGLNIVLLVFLFLILKDYEQSTIIGLILSSVMLIPTLIFAIIIERNACPSFIQTKETYTDSNGDQRHKLRIEFRN